MFFSATKIVFDSPSWTVETLATPPPVLFHITYQAYHPYVPSPNTRRFGAYDTSPILNGPPDGLVVYGQDQSTYWYGLLSSGAVYVLGVSDPTSLLGFDCRFAIRYH